MSERPILFSAAMVRAILAGRKSQTRRVIKPPRSTGAFVLVERSDGSMWPHVSHDGESFDDGNGREVPMHCPYGVPGDKLWVREMWARVEPYPTVFQKYSVPTALISDDPELLEYWRKRIIFRADFPDKQPEECGMGATDGKWRPSIHMPRWASRITLDLTKVRVERVQDISEEDAIAEGYSSREAFLAGAWAAKQTSNPLLWALNFSRTEVQP